MQFKALLELFSHEMYLLSYDGTKRAAYIVLKEGANPENSFKAWAHALLLSHRLDKVYATSAVGVEDSELLQSTLVDLRKSWGNFLKQLSIAGWDLNVANLETTSGTRVRLNANSSNDHSSLI